MDILFQMRIIKHILGELHLDKTMLSKNNLMQYINSHYGYPTNSITKECIRHLNSDSKKKQPSIVTLNKYKGEILNSGIHFLYTNSLDLKPVLVDEILSNLPFLQQENNRVYGKSSTLEDIWRCH